MTVHKLETMQHHTEPSGSEEWGPLERFIAHCSCGWKSDECYPESLAEDAVVEHMYTVAAAVTSMPVVMLSDYVSSYVIPGKYVNQDHSVQIGPCVYSRFPGRWYVYKVYDSLNAIGLQLDGTWSKYGEQFESAQAALEAVSKTPYLSWGGDPRWAT